MESENILSFIGRETFLQTMHATIQHNQRVVLTGRCGVGKSATAREYVRRFGRDYQFVCWLNMATDETLLADLLAVLHILSLPVTMTQGVAGLFQRLQDYLSTQQNFLVILDNPPLPFQMRPPPEQQQMAGHLLLITRSYQASPEAACLELAGLEAQDGALLVLRQAGLLAMYATLDEAEEEQRLAALELARELRGSLIGLNLAGRYLRETGCSVEDYLLAFRDSPTRLHLHAGSEDEDMAEVAVPCDLSLLHLEQARPASLAYLQMSALLLPESIPTSLFQQEAERTPGSDEEESETSMDHVQPLLLSGLLIADQETATLSMHPLIQDGVRQFFALDRPQSQVERVLRLFQSLLPTLATETLAVRLRVAGHIRHLAKLSEDWPLFFDATAEVFSWAARLVWEQGLVGTAEPLLRRALVIWERTLGSAHPEVATVLGHLVTLNSLLKNYAEAEALAHRAIASKSKALGANHPDILLALAQLGQVYAAQGKQKEARLCYEKALSIGERVGLTRHAAYTTVRYDLALLCIEQAQFERAESVLRQVCLLWERSLGRQDPTTMAARFSLAEVLARSKKWERAEASYRRALPVCEQLLGAEHLVTLDHLERAALVYLQRGNIAEAKYTLQRVLEVKERTLGSQHLAVATCLNSLARVALEQEHLSEALDLLVRAQDISANQPQVDKLVLAAILDTRASTEEARGHHEQAILTYKQALELRGQALGEEHPDLVETLSSLASIYLTREEFQQAESLLLQALFIYQNAQKLEDLILDPVLNSLAEIEIARQNRVKAAMYLERSRAIRELALGEGDPRTVEVTRKLAELSQAQTSPNQKSSGRL